jgi:hypothetical protein
MTIGMRRGTTGVTALLVSGLVLAATAACSSSGGPDTAGPNATNQQTAGGTATSAAAGSSSAAVGTPADPATKQAVTTAYEHFFSGTAAPSVSQQALQHGEAFKAVLEQQAKGQYSKDSGVKVGDVSTRGQVADVTFTITSKGKPLLANIKGFAVQEGGTWKVAAKTFCLLLKLQGNPPSVCSDSSIISLPQ